MNGDSDPDAQVVLLIDNLNRAYLGPSWHGTSLRGTLRGLKPAAAAWSPAADRNSIWALILHAAYWKYTVRRRLTGEKRGSFARAPADFPKLPDSVNAASLKADMQLLHAEHTQLCEVVGQLSSRRLEDKLGSWRVVDLVAGAAAHDLYHAGQINLLKRLRAS